MTTRTQDQFVREVLGKLGALGAGQTQSAEDDTLVKARLVDVLEQLEDDDLISFDIDDGIPSKTFLPLAYLVAVHLIDHFGANEKTQTIFAGAQWGEKQLQKQKQDGPFESAPVKVEYF